MRSQNQAPQRTATCCNTLQHTATYITWRRELLTIGFWPYLMGNRNTLQSTASHYNNYNTLQHTADSGEIEVESCTLQQHTASHYNTLQHTTRHCNTLQHTATHCNTLQHSATRCNTWQIVVYLRWNQARCNTLQPVTTRCNPLQPTTTRCNPLQHATRTGPGGDSGVLDVESKRNTTYCNTL